MSDEQRNGTPDAGETPDATTPSARGATDNSTGSSAADSADPAAATADPTVGAADPATGTPGPSAAESAAESGAAASTATEAPEGESRRQRRKREKAAKPRRKAPWWELPVLVAVAIGIAILVKSFVAQPFYIPSESMEQTLHGCGGCSGDRILVNKPIYSVIRDPEPGDIVVFDAPPNWDREEQSTPPSNPVVRAVRGFGQLIGFVPPDGEVLVKRVIAIGGQTVKGNAQGDVFVSNTGKVGPYRKLAEPYTYYGGDKPSGTPFNPVTVPKGRLWVMGDHRNASSDSRYHCSFGSEDPNNGDSCNPVASTIPLDNVIGKAFVIAWPPSRWRTLGTPSTFESAAAMAGPALPGVASLATVLPVLVVRRRRRR